MKVAAKLLSAPPPTAISTHCLLSPSSSSHSSSSRLLRPRVRPLLVALSPSQLLRNAVSFLAAVDGAARGNENHSRSISAATASAPVVARCGNSSSYPDPGWVVAGGMHF